MEIIVIVNIPMRKDMKKKKYGHPGTAPKASEREVAFPVSAFMEVRIKPEDRVKCLMIAKTGEHSCSVENTKAFMDEFNAINESIQADVSYETIESEFKEDATTHEELMLQIVKQINSGSNIIADITFGPKDLPIVEFSALNFAERCMDCNVDHIIYGQGFFDKEGNLTETKICDLIPLYSLNTLVSTFQCENPDVAKEMLETVIRM